VSGCAAVIGYGHKGIKDKGEEERIRRIEKKIAFKIKGKKDKGMRIRKGKRFLRG
jgi:hypothetical protein